MFRIGIASVLIASVAAGRVQVESHKFETKFGASCEDLQTSFHTRVVGLQDFLDAHSDESNFNTATQARFMMRSYQIIRTLRRANTCAWVVDGDSDDIEQTRAIVQTLIAGNPCAEAARDELAAGRSAETAQIEVQSVWRAMSVLQSDNCEIAPYEESDTISLDDEVELNGQLEDLDAQAQDSIDVVLDEIEEDAGGALVQTDSDVRMRSFRTVMRTLGVVFLMIFLLLACAGTAAIISAFLAFAISQYTVLSWCAACHGDVGLLHAFHAVFFGFLPGGAIGLAACSHQLYTQLLPALQQAGEATTNITTATQ